MLACRCGEWWRYLRQNTPGTCARLSSVRSVVRSRSRPPASSRSLRRSGSPAACAASPWSCVPSGLCSTSSKPSGRFQPCLPTRSATRRRRPTTITNWRMSGGGHCNIWQPRFITWPKCIGGSCQARRASGGEDFPSSVRTLPIETAPLGAPFWHQHGTSWQRPQPRRPTRSVNGISPAVAKRPSQIREPASSTPRPGR